MDRETLILGGFFIFYTAFIMIVIGIFQYKSRKPVGFWTCKEPPKAGEVTDIKKYNHKHGIMWMIYGFGMILLFLTGTIFGDYAACIMLTAECTIGPIFMALYHNRLERLYVRKSTENQEGKKL